jgi:hypothetical protein
MPLCRLKKKGSVQNMFRRKHRTDTTTGLLQLMGQLQAIINRNRTELAPGLDWAKFREELLALSSPKTRRDLEHVAVMVQLGLGNSDGSINDYDLLRAVRALQEIIDDKKA